jgi:hypothetical protein
VTIVPQADPAKGTGSKNQGLTLVVPKP